MNGFTIMGDVVEETWTTIAADRDGEVLPDEIGRRTVTRRAHFAFRAEAEAWLADQEKEGFKIPDGFSGIAPCATRYFGPTDAPTNCWSVNVEKPIEES